MNRFSYTSGIYRRPPIEYIEVGQIWLFKAPDTSCIGCQIVEGHHDGLIWGNSFWKIEDWFKGKLKPRLQNDPVYIFTGGTGYYEQDFRRKFYLSDFKESIHKYIG